MSAAEIKTEVLRMLDFNDEPVLLQIHDLLKKRYNTPLAELGGQTLNEFNKEMDENEAEIDGGKFLLHEAVVEMSKKWGQK